MRRLATLALLGAVLGGVEAHASTSAYPYRYGFPNPSRTSYSPHFYWNSGVTLGSYQDQRTPKRWQGHVPWGMVNAYLNDPLPAGPRALDPFIVR